MLARYQIYRGKRPDADPLPEGVRQDTRHRCSKHPLHPTKDIVTAYLEAPTDPAWNAFRRKYLALLAKRFREDHGPFDGLAALATDRDVFIGCSCPTKKNPRLDRCHTVLALGFMKEKYPTLRVEFPAGVTPAPT